MVFRNHKKVSNEGPLSHVSRLFHKWLGPTKPAANMKNGLGTQAIDACELENRILYSGSPLPVDMMLVDAAVEVGAVMDVAVDCQPAEESPFEMQMDTFDIASLVDPVTATDTMLTAVVGAPSGIDELVFIDSGIENYQTMLADLHGQFGESANSEIIVLQSGDGITQITETLSQHRDLRAIHFVSHGSGDGVELGGMSLSTHNLSSYASDIASWQAALTEDADILFYGCDLAKDAAGSEFLEMISALTTADVAGSDDLTGHASLEGNWELEFVTGELETELVFSAEFRDTWVHTLIDRSTVSGESTTSRGGTFDGPLLHTNELWISLQQTSTSRENVNGELVLKFGGAGLQLGDQGNDATISKLLSLGRGNNIDGLHYVTQDTQVIIGENTFSLEVGDVLLSTENDVVIDESLPGAGDALSFAADDIFLLKPTANGRYLADVTQLSMVLDLSTVDLSGASTLGSFTLIENSFSLGGYELGAGEILFAEASSAKNNDVHLLHSADNDHDETISRVIDGQAIGWQTAIHGMDVIEKTITVGGQLLTQGTIVFAAPTSDTGTPMDMGAWSCADVVAFDISQTEMTGGTQSEDQLVLLDSSKMGFPCEQGFFSLTIIGEEVESAFANNQLIVEEGETVTLDDSQLNYNSSSPALNQVEYVVSKVTGGYFALSSNVSTAIDTFSQTQVSDGLVVFVDDGDEQAPTYEVGLSTSDGTVLEVASGSVLFTPLNDAPLINLQSSEFTVQANTGSAELLGISIADQDGDTQNFAVTVRVAHGTLELVGGSELVMTGNGSSQVTVSGDLAGINQALTSLTYHVESEYAGTDTLTIAVSDHTEDPAVSLSQTYSANIQVLAEVDTGPTDYFTGGEFNLTENNRITKIGLHGLFECSGTAETHPDPTFTVTDVSNPELFCAVRITADDMVQMTAIGDRVGSSTIIVRATGSDGTYSEAEFTVNVDTSSGGERKLGAKNSGVLSQLHVLDRSANVYEGLDGGVTVIQLETCSDLSISVITGETSRELESELQETESSVVEEPTETVVDGEKLDEMVVETGTISAVVINDKIPSTSSASGLASEGAAVAGSSDVFEIEFKSRTSVRFQSAESSSSYFEYQVQTLTNNAVNLQANPFTVVLESANSFAFASLNDYSEGIDEAVDYYGVALTGSLISLSGVSIGVVGWMARNSALVTSLMASMPTWQLIDPLVVLGDIDDLDPGESVMDIIASGGTGDRS